MIKDPISEGGGVEDKNEFRANFVESIAVGNTETDIPTLLSYLRSEEVLTETSQLFNIGYDNLKKNIRITIPREKDVTKSFRK